jgi:beta-mannosidase
MTTLPPGSVIGSVPTLWLHEGWRLGRSAPGAVKNPSQLAGAGIEWHDAVVPGTVAAAIHKDINLPGDYDADDWWYQLNWGQTTFCRGEERAFPHAANSGLSPIRHYLRFDGLATLAEVWLNGTPILSSRNMFVTHRVDVTELLREQNELVICFRSLGEALKQRRARPKWKTQLVNHQNLRWFRTTLLGRIPGWTPAISPVGPWAPIGIESVDRIEMESLAISTTRDSLTVKARVSAPVDQARVRIGEREYPLTVAAREIQGAVAVDVPAWWPHTHGEPHLESCQLELLVDGEWIVVDCGRVGLRDIRLDTHDGAVRFIVNDIPVFCRGACWTTLDILRLRGDPRDLRRALETLRDSGANMVRIGGTMAYESEDFYRLCDELGILVWQDFMFANMDYPVADADFRREIEAEARQVVSRLHRHPCIAAYCGGSEVAQQAAMMGLPKESWSNDFFTSTLPALCEEMQPGVAYFPSSPWGGALPFHVSTGIAHYYGVGAYRRPLADVKSARVKFATECLGISNVPEAETMSLVMDGMLPPPHHPRWKSRVPRDSGSGYDFEDVRDHYLEILFRERAAELRAQDVPRYYAISRVVSGEVMSRIYGEWRAPSSGCGGALVWFWRDLWPGAGWGLTDSEGRPKAALWHLRRAWSPRSIHLTDEGLDGYAIHAINESAEPLEAIVEMEMYANGRSCESAQMAATVPARGAITLQADALLGYFSDATNAYRFGPPKYDVVTARMMRADTGEILAEDFRFPSGMDLREQRDAELDARAVRRADGTIELTLRSDVFLQSVRVECDGYTPSDNYFHLAPNLDKRIVLRGSGDFSAHVEALNWTDSRSLRLAIAERRAA